MDQLSIIFFPIPVLHTGVFLTVMRSLKPILTWEFLSSCLGSNLVPRKPRNKDSPLFLFIQRGHWKMLTGFRLVIDTPFEFKPSVFRSSALSIFYQDGCHSCRCHLYHGYEIIVFILLLFWSVVYSVTVLHGLLQGLYFVDAPLDRATYNNDN